MRKTLIIFFICVCAVTLGAERGEPRNKVDTSNMQLMHTTAYCTGHTTANGSQVHVGGCSCNPHLGDVAIVYTLDGNYIGMFECNDTGGTRGLKNGTVIDVYFPTLDECKAWSRLFGRHGGKCYVLWVEGNG